MKVSTSPKKRTKATTDQSISVTQSGDNNQSTIVYQSPPPTDAEVCALWKMIEAQNELIRVYQNRRNTASYAVFLRFWYTRIKNPIQWSYFTHKVQFCYLSKGTHFADMAD